MSKYEIESPATRIPSVMKSSRKLMLSPFLTPVLLSSMFLASPVYSEGINKIELIASTCFTCHGVNGVGSGKIPELQDLKKSDITESLLGFSSGDEKSTIMGRHAKAYSKEEIYELAEYFVKLNK
jgi:sulfide dehydrogenase cytochrome subunit